MKFILANHNVKNDISSLLIVMYLIFSFSCLSAQKPEKIDEYSGNIFHISLNYGYQFPLADLKELYGNNFNVGLVFENQLKNNFLFGIEGQYLFGNDVKPDVLKNLKNSEGVIYGNDKSFASVVLKERGWFIQGYLGKIIPISNPRSGIKLKVGAGFFQHKIRIQDDLNTVNQVKGDYRKGYDRMVFGIGVSPFLGYQFISNNKRVNFYIGVESILGFTEGRRDYQFDTMSPFRDKRFDAVLGFKAGWILPFFTGVPSESYYY